MSNLNLFIPITKIDEENRLVYGRIAAEEIDNSGELFDYESSKPNFEKWSNDQFEASGGLSKGNVRAMHGPIAAGMLTDIHFDDDNRTIEGCAKIVDDNEWRKCLAGVYTGFSMGGRYARRWNEGGVRKYEALPAEVSIVDKPCIKSARFDGLLKCDLVKADGTVEQMELGKAWDESKHPRAPKGGPDGGKFVGTTISGQRVYGRKVEGTEQDNKDMMTVLEDDEGEQYRIPTESVRDAVADFTPSAEMRSYGGFQGTLELSGFDREAATQMYDTVHDSLTDRGYSGGEAHALLTSTIGRHIADQYGSPHNWHGADAGAKINELLDVRGWGRDADRTVQAFRKNPRDWDDYAQKADGLAPRTPGPKCIMALVKSWDPSKHPRHPKGSSEGGKFSGSGNTYAQRVADASEETKGLYNRVYESAAAAGWDNVDADGNSPIEEAISWAATQLEPSDDFETWDATVQSYLEQREEGIDPTAEKVAKGDNMYEPTNDEMLARAQTLAKAAGKTDADWLEFKDAARDEIIAEHGGGTVEKSDKPEHTDDDCKVGEGCEKCAGMEKAAGTGDTDATVEKADVPELEQGWKAKDGSFHLKKSDAIAHNATLAAGPSLADQISGLREDLGKSDVDPVEAALAVVSKMDEDQLTKFATTEDTPLAKFIADAVAAGRAEERDELTKSDTLLLKVDDPAVAERLAKFDTVVEENQVLTGKVETLQKMVDDAGPAIAELKKDIAAIKAMPIPGGPAATDTTRVVDKSADRGALSKGDAPMEKGDLLGQLNKAIASGELKAEDVADAAIRASQQNPTQIRL